MTTRRKSESDDDFKESGETCPKAKEKLVRRMIKVFKGECLSEGRICNLRNQEKGRVSSIDFADTLHRLETDANGADDEKKADSGNRLGFDNVQYIPMLTYRLTFFTTFFFK